MLIGLESMPCSARKACVPFVARILKPSSWKSLAGSMTLGLSLSATVIRTVPSSGNGNWVASWALKKARPKESAIPSTSPVDRISGPSSGSTSGSMLKGKTASFTPKYGIIFFLSPSSESFVPNMIWVAIRAIGILQTFETMGTVREALGLASKIYTVSSAMAYCIFIKPTTLSSIAILRVYS